MNSPFGPGKALFDSKEHYLAFRKAWAAAVNNPRVKRTINYYTFPTRTIGDITIKGRVSAAVTPGWLTATHHLLFNILCDRDLHTGFKCTTNKKKLLHSSKYINHEYYKAVANLKWRIAKAKDSLDMTAYAETRTLHQRSKWQELTKSWTDSFLEPFNNTVTPEMLVKIELPKVEQIVPSWGLGEAIAKKIINGARYSIAELEQIQKRVERIEVRTQVGKTTIIDYNYIF